MPALTSVYVSEKTIEILKKFAKEKGITVEILAENAIEEEAIKANNSLPEKDRIK